MNRIAFSLAAALLVPAPGCSKSRSEGTSSAPGSAGAGGDSAGSGFAADDAIAATAGDEESTPIAVDPDAGYDEAIQAGLLTAGTFDDTLNSATFAAFMQSMHAWSPDLAQFTGPLAVVRLVDDEGRPLPGVAVRVRGENGNTKKLVTGTDGRVVLFHPLQGNESQSGLQLRVESAGQDAWQSIDTGEHTITVPRAQPESIRALDIALVIDATGSMGDEIEYLKVELRSIATAVSHAFPNVDQRYALVVYRDDGDAYVTRHFDFTSNLKRFERNLGQQRADGGGDYPEAMHLALADAAELSWRADAGTARIAFVVADAPPHDQDVAATLGAVEQLRAQGVGIYPVAASGVAAEAEAVMRAAAVASGGQYVFLTDDSGIGNAHEEPHIPCYAVESLRDAMTRMVQTELSGARIEAQRAVRTVGRSKAGVCESLKRAG